MKFAKLLVLSALLLLGSVAKAAVPDGVWTMPEPQGLEFTTFTDDGTHYILYNPAAKMFFASGNGWNTMASLRTFGMEVWLQPASEEDAPEGSYNLCDLNVNNPERSTGEGNIFTDDGDASWVDHGTQANFSWGCEIANGFVRLQNVALIADKPEFAGKYLGWNGTYVTTDNTANSGDHRNAYTAILRHVDPAAEGACVDWKAVTVESYEAFVLSEGYNAYVEGTKTYIASIGLKAAIENAEANNIDATAALAVYSNNASTAAELAQATKTLNEIVEAKTKLKAAIDEYEAKGYTATEAAKAVLNNPQATKAEVDKAKEELDAAVIEWGKNNASVENPADMTAMIKNPHFNNGDCTTGWSGEPFGRGGTVSDGAEHYSKNYDTYQTITGLAPGVYAIGVNAYYRAGNYGGTAEGHWLAKDEASKYAKLYGKVGDNYYEIPIANVMDGAQTENQNQGDSEVTYQDAEGNDVTVYVPNTMATGDYYMHTLHQYANKLIVAVDESGELTIGVKKTSQIGGDWSFFDDFSLTYYGTGADAAKLYLDETLKNYSEMTLEEGTVYTEAYLTAYNEELAKAKDIQANSYAEVSVAMAEVQNAKNALEKNIQLWKQWQDDAENAYNTYCVDPTYNDLISPGDIGDYHMMEFEEYLAEPTLTNEELEAEIAKIAAMVQAVKDEYLTGDIADGSDMTRFITNPGFDADKDIDSGAAEGWTIDAGSGGNITRGPLGKGNKELMEGALGYMNYCFEAWHRYNWDVWQEVENLPKGMYELSVQGYVRCEVGGYTKGNDINPDFPSPIYLYMNSARAQFPSVYSESPADYDHEMVQVEDWYQEVINDKPYPNSMGGAAQCFGWGMYTMKAYGLIAKQGDKFRIGVRNDSNQDWWCIWDNFKLTYRKPTVDIVKPILEEELAKLDLNQGMGSEVIESLNKVREDAVAALASNDGDQMFDALVAVYDISDAIQASVKKFNELNTANEDMVYLVPTAEVDEIRNEANALYLQIFNGILNHTIATEEVDGLLNEIAKMINRLGLPNGMAEASDANPVECTGVIRTPSFELDGANSSAGWTDAGNLGNDDTQKSVLAIEFWQNPFDMYQTIYGLPKGTYKLTVNAWCRVGDNQQNYDAWMADNATTMAFVYAVDGDSVVYSAPIANVMKGAMTEATGNDGEAEFTVGEVTYYMPGSLVSGRYYMDAPNEGVYTNSVICKVGDDGKLTIGIKKDEQKDNSWVVLDDFRLFYLGANSSEQLAGDPSSVNAIATAPVKVEVFNVNGARLSKAQKGLVIVKKTMNDGSVKVLKKVQK